LTFELPASRGGSKVTYAVRPQNVAGDDLGKRPIEDETCVTELAILGLAEANSNFIGPAIRVWGPPPLQSYDNEGINKALRQLDCFFIYFPV